MFEVCDVRARRNADVRYKFTNNGNLFAIDRGI